MKKHSAGDPGGTALMVRRALLSVSDKRGIAELAKELVSFGVEIISTGGTADVLKKAGVAVTSVSDVTGFPEILDGRVKTLHPSIHGGILAVLDNPDHVKQLREHHIDPIDLIVVNLYPFQETIAKPEVTHDEALENIDIGGPTLVRASAKNYRHTAVVVNPGRYDDIVREMKANGGAIQELRRYALACEAFEHTAQYDAAIVSYLRAGEESNRLPESLIIAEPKAFNLRYGENPHQAAALYGSLENAFEKLHGKELSFNNILDAHAAVGLVAEFDEPTVVIVKHNNPCGVGSASELRDAYMKAFATDGKSAFGGIVAVNRTLDESAAEAMNSLFLEVIIAPDFSDGAMTLLRKKKDRRLLRLKGGQAVPSLDIRRVFGGFLVQEQDGNRFSIKNVNAVTKRVPTKSELEGLHFAWRVAKHVKSNAIVYALPDRTVGIGAGQMSRVDSARIAAMKASDAGLDLKGSVAASDAFFPFADGLLECVKAGATAVIQPGGSVRDQEVIQAADENSVAMVFTGIRHFRH